MKHSLKVTMVLIAIFLLAQIAGIAVIAQYLDVAALQNGEIAWTALPFGFERPQVEENISYWYLFFAILLGTALAFVLIRFRAMRTWKIWFLLAIVLCLTFSFAAFLPQLLAFGLALFLAVWKIFRPNIIVHNLAEVFVYGGIAAMFVPILNVFSVTMLLLLIAGYDAFAVWQSKHMVKLAQFQSDAKLFAGVFIPYHIKGHSAMPRSAHSSGAGGSPIAVLGGGDIAFPLLFTGAVLKKLALVHPLSSAIALSGIITLFSGVALTLLLLWAKPKKFYPAMPFLALGCFAGYGVLQLLLTL